MGKKYEPLNIFLRGQRGDVVPLTFTQIEKVLGRELPPSKKQRAWWSNNPDNNVMTKEWLGAGFETEAVDIAGEKLVFRRIRLKESEMEEAGFGETVQSGFKGSARPTHPGIGFMEGLITFAPGIDIEGPYSNEVWGEGYLGEDRLVEAEAGEPRK